MADKAVSAAGCVRYELEIEIKASREAVWKAMIDETNAWWLPDFHMVGEGSTVEFDVRPGGRGLIEHRDNGAFLLWCSVHFYLPEQFKIYLVGHLAPDWGGPSTSNLCFSLEERPSGCVLRVSDAHHGHVDAGNIRSLQEGWGRLFGDGLRRHVEGTS